MKSILFYKKLQQPSKLQLSCGGNPPTTPAREAIFLTCRLPLLLLLRLLLRQSAISVSGPLVEYQWTPMC
jgi:hypothetical protein